MSTEVDIEITLSAELEGQKGVLYERNKENFHYHPPSEAGKIRHEILSREFERLAQLVVDILLPGRDLSETLTLLEDAKMWASAGVARNPITR